MIRTIRWCLSPLSAAARRHPLEPPAVPCCCPPLPVGAYRRSTSCMTKKNILQKKRSVLSYLRRRKEVSMILSDELLRNLARTCVGRLDSYAVQQANGLYLRYKAALTMSVLRAHLEGTLTIASYPVTERNLCRFAVFDADHEEGLRYLVQLQQTFAGLSIPSYLEKARRGIHLRLFLFCSCSPVLLRQALLPYCPPGMEFFPKRDWADWEHPGNAVRLPLGVHRRTGLRYPFVEYKQSCFVPYARMVTDTLSWLSTVERVSLEALSRLAQQNEAKALSAQKEVRPQKPLPVSPGARYSSIREWNACQDPLEVIGRYVDLDRHGMGCCPFGSHHKNGKDTHPSLKVYDPSISGGCCWWCHAWGKGGSVFDFLKLYYGLEPKELWHRILSGGQF
jgi:hypothetical protein